MDALRVATITPTARTNEDLLGGLAPDNAWLDVYETARAALRLRREHPHCASATTSPAHPTIPGGPKDLMWLHPSGREMTEGDWYDGQHA